MVAMATTLEELKKAVQIDHLRAFSEKIVKIGPVNPEIIVLRAITKNKEINTTKTYSPVGKFAERVGKFAKQTKQIQYWWKPAVRTVTLYSAGLLVLGSCNIVWTMALVREYKTTRE